MNIQTRPRSGQHLRSLDGRVSIVTGSTSGIGLGIARALAAAGSALLRNAAYNPEHDAALSGYGWLKLYEPVPRRLASSKGRGGE